MTPTSSAAAGSAARPSVSVVVPCYGHAGYLGDALDSVFQQTQQVLEVIVVDDCSPDDTAEVVRSRPEPVTYIRHPENRGLAASRNTGIAAASGDFVVSLDADDMLDPTYVEKCQDALKEHPESGYAYTQWKKFGARTGVSTFPHFSLANLKAQNFIHASAMLPRSLLTRFRYDERIRSGWEDWDLYLRLARAGVVGVLVDEPLLLYRQHESSMFTESVGKHFQRYGRSVYIQLKNWRLYGIRGTLRALRGHTAFLVKGGIWPRLHGIAPDPGSDRYASEDPGRVVAQQGPSDRTEGSM